jgi:hypothetical protein
MKYLIVAALVTLAGCSSFKMGTAVYIPHGQVGTVSVGPAASAPAK